MFSSFHCSSENNFTDKNQLVRGFIYDNYHIEPHKHEFYEINIIMSGHGIHLIENNSLEAETGDVFVIPPNIVHSYINTKNMNVFHIIIKQELIDSIADEKKTVRGFNIFMEIEPYLRNKCEKKMFLHLSSSEFSALMPDLTILRDDIENKYKDCNPIKNHTTIKILYYMSDLIYSQNITKTSKHPGYNIVSVLDYINRNYSQKITIDDLCNYSNVSKSTLIRQFKENCSCTPIQYLIECRKNAAKKMISENKLSRTQIAYECGFYDLSHMERNLKKESIPQ